MSRKWQAALGDVHRLYAQYTPLARKLALAPAGDRRAKRFSGSGGFFCLLFFLISQNLSGIVAGHNQSAGKDDMCDSPPAYRSLVLHTTPCPQAGIGARRRPPRKTLFRQWRSLLPTFLFYIEAPLGFSRDTINPRARTTCATARPHTGALSSIQPLARKPALAPAGDRRAKRFSGSGGFFCLLFFTKEK